MELTGLGVTPGGPSHCMPEVSGMAIGREMEQVQGEPEREKRGRGCYLT